MNSVLDLGSFGEMGQTEKNSGSLSVAREGTASARDGTGREPRRAFRTVRGQQDRRLLLGETADRLQSREDGRGVVGDAAGLAAEKIGLGIGRVAGEKPGDTRTVHDGRDMAVDMARPRHQLIRCGRPW